MSKNSKDKNSKEKSAKDKDAKSDLEAARDLLDWRGLIGFESAWQQAALLQSSGRMPSCLLIRGREGIGKRLLAAKLAALHFCDQGSSCGECNPCRNIREGRMPEVFTVDQRGAAIKLDDIASVRERLETRSHHTSRVIVLVDAERLTKPAANHLLKILEEPPEGGYFILTSSFYRNVLPTIKSRASLLHAASPSAEEAAGLMLRSLDSGNRWTALKIADLYRLLGRSIGQTIAVAKAFDPGFFEPGREAESLLSRLTAMLNGEEERFHPLLWELFANRAYRLALKGQISTEGTQLQRHEWRRRLNRATQASEGEQIKLNGKLQNQAFARNLFGGLASNLKHG